MIFTILSGEAWQFVKCGHSAAWWTAVYGAKGDLENG